MVKVHHLDCTVDFNSKNGYEYSICSMTILIASFRFGSYKIKFKCLVLKI